MRRGAAAGGSPAGGGPQPGCVISSRTAPGCATTRTTSGGFCARLAGAASARPGKRSSATGRGSGIGRSIVGLKLKKSARREAHHHLRRRKRIERTTASSADLGAARTDASSAVSLQLEGVIGRRRNHLVEFLLPALSYDHSRTAGGRLPRSLPASSARQAVGGLGRATGTSGAAGQRIYPRAARSARDRVVAGLRPRTQSGRVHLGLLETSSTA